MGVGRVGSLASASVDEFPSASKFNVFVVDKNKIATEMFGVSPGN